jgi:hypothetical protein
VLAPRGPWCGIHSVCGNPEKYVEKRSVAGRSVWALPPTDRKIPAVGASSLFGLCENPTSLAPVRNGKLRNRYGQKFRFSSDFQE